MSFPDSGVQFCCHIETKTKDEEVWGNITQRSFDVEDRYTKAGQEIQTHSEEKDRKVKRERESEHKKLQPQRHFCGYGFHFLIYLQPSDRKKRIVL